jgi:hypothetical protein
MIESGVTKKDAYVWYSYDLTHKPLPDNKPGWYTIKSDTELTVEEKESLKICKSLWKREVEKEQECAKSGKKNVDEKENESAKLDSTNRESYIVFRRDLDCAIWVIRNTTEFDRLTILHEIAVDCGKLIGFNAMTGDWNQNPFPVTPTDAQKKVIRSDIDAYMKALSNFDEYSQYLGRKYNLEVGELKHYKEWIFCHQPTVPSNKYGDMAMRRYLTTLVEGWPGYEHKMSNSLDGNPETDGGNFG